MVSSVRGRGLKFGLFTPYKPGWRHRLLLIGVPVAVLVVGGFFMLRVAYGPLPFDRVRWDATTDWQDKTRHRMADGLLESGRLIGKSRAEIVNLLGEPPPTNYFDEFELVYELGQERGLFGIDSEWLVMRIGATGTVSEALLATD
jgi:hypothetical protein